MKNFFKWFFLSFTLFLVLLFAVAGLLSDKYSVERSITICAPKDSVFKVVANLNTWREWNPWFLIDSLTVSKISVTENIVGSYWEWNSKQIGKGKLVFTKAFPSDSLYAKMNFVFPKKSVVDEFWYFQNKEDSTLVIWKHTGKLEYPMGRILGFWSDGMLGPTFEEGLKLLKNKIENE